MRDIKFRAWDEKNKQMYRASMSNIYRNPNSLFGDIYLYQTSMFGETVRVELMQYTGLKDKNGIEIYEGDILKFEDGGEEGYEYQEGYDFVNTAAVCFSDGRFELTNFGTTNSTVYEEMHGSDHEEFIMNFELAEVIGNIYQDKELLNQN